MCLLNGMGFEKFASCSIRDFNLEEELFRGSAGSVWKALFKYDKKKYVLKQNKLDGSRSRKQAMNEIELLMQLSHPNCIKCHGHFFDDSHNSIYIVLDYCEGGDLHKLLEERRATSSYLDESEIWNYFLQICLGVQHLHEMGIVHRDLKTLNILLSRDRTQVKVADLGVSRQVSQDTFLLETFHGTPLYLSPEMVDGSLYTEKTDIWSLGVILFELVALHPPFKGPSLLALAQAIKSGRRAPLPPKYTTPGSRGSSLERCIDWLLQQDYRQRPSINQVVRRVTHHAADSVIEPNPLSPSPALPSPGVRSKDNMEETPTVPASTAAAAPACEEPARARGHSRGSDRDADKYQTEQSRRPVRPRGKTAPRTQTEQCRAPTEQVTKQDDISENRRVPTDQEVTIDMNRLLAVERRERMLLKRLLQTRALNVSHISEGYVGGGGAKGGPSELVEDPRHASLDAKIETSRARLAVVENAVGANGRIARSDLVL